jgi:hypothetical protein
MGRWLKGQTGNKDGRLPRQTETEYLEVTMREVTPEKWAEVIALALEDAMDPEKTATVRARAREWLGKYLIGEPSQIHQMLYKEERKFEIHVIFGDVEEQKLLPDIVDMEPVIIHED